VLPPSAARRSWGPSWRQAGVPCGVSEGSEDPWLCGPGFRQVCLVEECDLLTTGYPNCQARSSGTSSGTAPIGPHPACRSGS
jgi:hypothetical protein